MIESCIRGYHVYMASWSPILGESLVCELEFSIVHDPYAVAVCRSSDHTTVGHIQRNISAICYFFIKKAWKHNLSSDCSKEIFS